MPDYYQGFPYASVRACILTVKPVWEVSAWPDLSCVGACLQLCMWPVITGQCQVWLLVTAARGCLQLPMEKYQVLSNLLYSTLLWYLLPHNLNITWSASKLTYQEMNIFRKDDQNCYMYHLRIYHLCKTLADDSCYPVMSKKIQIFAKLILIYVIHSIQLMFYS